MDRRCMLLSLALSAPGLAFAQAPAGSFPNRPVRLVVPFPPGGSADGLARTIGQHLQAAWGQTVIIDNKPGGGTIIGVDAVAKSPPDGHTIGLVIPSLAVNPSLNATMPYDTRRDLMGVTQLVSLPIGLYAANSLPVSNVAELIAYGRKNPKSLSYGSAGNGSTSHLAGQMMNQMAGLDMIHVPYKGSAPAQTDLIGGRLSLLFDSFASQLPMLQSGRLKLLAIAGPRRLPNFPNVPTIGETIKDFSVESYFGVVAPRATPQAVIEQLHQAMKKAVDDPAVQSWMEQQGMAPVASTPAQFDAFIDADIRKWAEVVKSIGGVTQ